MSEKTEIQSGAEDNGSENNLEVWDMNNLHDFYKLLLEVDMRNNPNMYKTNKND